MATMAAGFRFLDLSYDLRSLIISYVPRPTDLKNLCLSCKALRDVAVRQLYRRVELDIGSEADLKLSALLSRGNPGLDHIRSLVLNPDPNAFPMPSLSHPDSPPPPPPPPAPANIPGLGPGTMIVPAVGLPPAPPPPAVNADADRSNSAEERRRRWSPAHFTVRLLIDLLPENILEKFRWTSYEEFSADNFILLCKKQKNLKTIEVGPCDRSLKDALERHPDLIKHLTQLHALDLYPDGLDCLEACHHIMKDTPGLDELWIESGIDAAPPGTDTSWEDESNKPGIITTTLFKDKIPFTTCTPMTLKVLALYKVNVRWVAQTYMRLIAFPNLTELEVRSCAGADAIFAEMAKPAKRPSKLIDLTFVHVEDGRIHQYIESSLENFLRSISSLKKLCVILVDGSNLPKADAICNHAAQLENLIVYASDSVLYLSEKIYPKDDFARICRDCKKLQQLAIGCPPTKLLEERLSGSLVEYLDHAFSLPDLVTLNMTAWPEYNARPELPVFGLNTSVADSKIAFDVYEHYVQRIAQMIFERMIKKSSPLPLSSSSLPTSTTSSATFPSAGNKLRVVAIGCNAKGCWVDNVTSAVKQLIYVPGTQTDPFGDRKMVACNVKALALKFIEPESDILDYRFPDPPPPPPS